MRGSRLYRDLLAAGRVGPALRARHEAETAEERRAVSMGAAHAGAGRLVEALAHDVMHTVEAEVPVTLADVPPPGFGPFIFLDLSAYGDPVSSRYARSAFSSHQKASATGLVGGPPFVITVPRGDRDPRRHGRSPVGAVVCRRRAGVVPSPLRRGAPDRGAGPRTCTRASHRRSCRCA